MSHHCETDTRVAYITKLLLSTDSKPVTHKNKPICKNNFEKKLFLGRATFYFCRTGPLIKSKKFVELFLVLKAPKNQKKSLIPKMYNTWGQKSREKGQKNQKHLIFAIF